jgi:hypothetical protein
VRLPITKNKLIAIKLLVYKVENTILVVPEANKMGKKDLPYCDSDSTRTKEMAVS